jgi:hypothetical protein
MYAASKTGLFNTIWPKAVGLFIYKYTRRHAPKAVHQPGFFIVSQSAAFTAMAPASSTQRRMAGVG